MAQRGPHVHDVIDHRQKENPPCFLLEELWIFHCLLCEMPEDRKQIPVIFVDVLAIQVICKKMAAWVRCLGYP